MTTQTTIDPDCPQSNDADPFGRLPFARQLADYLVLQTSQESLVLGLEGEWGSGKSWVIERVKRLLSEQTNRDGEAAVVVINFNPWLIGSETELIAAFMDELAAQITEHGNRSQRLQAKAGALARAVAAYGDKLSYLKYLKYVPGVAPVGEFFADHEQAIQGAVKKAQQALEPKKLSLAASRKLIENALQELTLPIVVIIDDLDRLRKTEIQTMIQLVKAVASFKGVSYLLSYDSRYVAQAISHDGTLASGFAYLEKIVQLACHLPPLVPWIYRDWLAASVRTLIGQRGKTLNEFETSQFDDTIKIVARLLRHPRDAYRWFNRLRWVMASLADALDFGDLMVVEALQIVSPESIRALVARPSLVFRQYDKHFFAEDALDLVAPDLGEWISQVAPETDIQRALLTLFPHLAHHSMQVTPDSMARAHRRLQVYEHWTRYLNLANVPGQRDAAYAIKLLANAHDYGKMENRFENTEELGEFCYAIVDYLTPENVADPVYFVSSFCKAASFSWGSAPLPETLAVASRCLQQLLTLSPEPETSIETIASSAPLSLSGWLMNQLDASAQARWLQQFDLDSAMRFVERDHPVLILQCLTKLRGLAAARSVARQIISKKQLSRLAKYFDAENIDERLFELLPRPDLIYPALQNLADGGHISRHILDCISNPESAAKIAQVRKNAAQTLRRQRKAGGR